MSGASNVRKIEIARVEALALNEIPLGPIRLPGQITFVRQRPRSERLWSRKEAAAVRWIRPLLLSDEPCLLMNLARETQCCDQTASMS